MTPEMQLQIIRNLVKQAQRTAYPYSSSVRCLALAIESLCDLLATRNDGETNG